MNTFNFLAFWVNNLDPFILRFPENFPIEGIRWYGLSYVLGFLIALGLLHIYYKKKRSPYNPDQQTTLITVIIISTIIGGRLGYMLLYSFHEFLYNPLSLFMTTRGGMASHGAVIGILIALFWFSKKTNTSFLGLCDIIGTTIPPGVFLGRIANFINGELWGKVSDVPWAVIFPTSVPEGYPMELIPPRHPSQLYEAGLEGLVLFVYLQVRFWTKGASLPKGQLAGECCIGYAIVRIICEVFRQPDAPLIFGLNPGQFYSLFLILGGITFILFSKRTKNGDSNKKVQLDSNSSVSSIKPQFGTRKK